MSRAHEIRWTVAILCLWGWATLLPGPARAQQDFDPMEGLIRTARTPAGLVVVDCNVYCGGRYTERDTKHVTWKTNEQFAKLLAKDCPAASVIGMEELDATAADRMKANLKKHTGGTWEHVFEEQGVRDRGSGLGVFWRTDRVDLIRRLGKTQIDLLDNGYVLRFMGVLLRDRISQRPFGVFTGKIAWDGAEKDGHQVRESDRVVEARRLKTWVQQVMAAYPSAPRILAMDMNSPHGSPTYREFAKDYEDDGTAEATHNSLFRLFGRSVMTKKLDYLWYDADSGPKKRGGFFQRATRSEHFGSDHRALWAKVRL
ncbi:MAG: endonuclease/exonuclease/phosphatase family protein [Candidatus Riflebacteria bacterium]|nr:endonuclease/exonuclease/phosphatase family protein [Candidatus Riflebacteria bacterium]